MRAGTPGDRKSTRLNSSHQSTRRLTLFPYTTLFRSNCSGATVGNNAPAIFPKGVTTVTWTVTDASGNTGTAAQTVTVEDHQNPTISAPGTVVVNTDADQCTASSVALGTPTFSDN